MNVEEYKKIAEDRKNSGEYFRMEQTQLNKAWTKDRKGKMPYIAKVMLFSFVYVIAICILMFVFMAMSEEYGVLLLVLVFILSMPVFFVFVKKNMSDFINFIFYDGHLYRLMYTKQSPTIMSDALPIQTIGVAFAISGVNKAINKASNAGADIENTITEMSNDPNTWRIDRIKELKVHKHGFKAKVVVTIVMSNKTKSKKINVSDDYIDYPLLLDTVKKLK